jgi:hypothetical protein
MENPWSPGTDILTDLRNNCLYDMLNGGPTIPMDEFVMVVGSNNNLSSANPLVGSGMCGGVLSLDRPDRGLHEEQIQFFDMTLREIRNPEWPPERNSVLLTDSELSSGNYVVIGSNAVAQHSCLNINERTLLDDRDKDGDTDASSFINFVTDSNFLRSTTPTSANPPDDAAISNELSIRDIGISQLVLSDSQVPTTPPSKRSRRPSNVSMANNLYGRKGALRCKQCRLWRQKVSHFLQTYRAVCF